MNQITFPLFNLTLNIPKIAIEIFGIKIYWYAIIIVLAIVIALLLCKKDDNKYNIKFDYIFEMMLYALPIGFICARLYYVIFNIKSYNSIAEIFNFRNGGLAIYGGIIGSILTIFIYCKIKTIESPDGKKTKLNFLDVLDYIVPYLALAQAIGRLGNFVNIEAYGYQTTLPWRMGIIKNNQYIEVHPTFLYEMILNISIFIILYSIRNKRKYQGQLTYIYLTMYSFGRMIIEGLRIDSLMLNNIRISQFLSFLIFVTFCSILIYKHIKHKKMK